MSAQTTHRGKRKRAEDEKIEAKRARGTLLPHEEPVVADVQVGGVQPSRNHSDKNRYLILKIRCPIITASQANI